MAEVTITIMIPGGLHARPAARLHRATRAFQSQITIQNLSRAESQPQLLSALGLLISGVRQGHRLRIHAEGADAQAALGALAALIESEQGGGPAPCQSTCAE